MTVWRDLELGVELLIVAVGWVLAVVTVPLWGPVWCVGRMARWRYPAWAADRDLAADEAAGRPCYPEWDE